MLINIDNILKKVSETVKRHALDTPGAYQRWLWQNEKQNRNLGVTEYAVADAANIPTYICAVSQPSHLPAFLMVNETAPPLSTCILEYSNSVYESP